MRLGFMDVRDARGVTGRVRRLGWWWLWLIAAHGLHLWLDAPPATSARRRSSIPTSEVLATVRSSRPVKDMEWASGAAVGDAVIVRQDPSSAPRFVVHGNHGAQVTGASYAEAEAYAASYAERSRANVWYLERGRPQLVSRFGSRSRG